jgi:ABC-type Mn2+/Zn2+ transport system permease subunit
MAAILSLLALHPRLQADTAIGVAETALFGIGLVLVSMRSDRIGLDLSHYLFGQVATVTRGDLATNAALTLIGAAMLVWLFHDLRAATFDPAHAALVGIRTGLLSWLLLSLLAVAIVVSLQTVGLLMSVAMLVTPAATARLLTERLVAMTLAAMGFGISAGVIGLTASYHLQTPPGATISLVAVAMLVVALGGSAAVRRRHDGRPFDRRRPASRPGMVANEPGPLISNVR